MGQGVSQLDQRHVGIYKKLLGIQNQQTRLQMIDTLLQDPGIVHTAKIAGVYSAVLQTAGAIRHGRPIPVLPGEQYQQQLPKQVSQQSQQSLSVSRLTQHPSQFQNAMVAVGGLKNQDPYQRLSKPNRKEKALTFFTACLKVLGIEEEVELTEDMLKSAYKRAVIKAHPDKGGSKEAFDAVTRAYAYLVDILRLVKGRSSKQGSDVVPGLDTVHSQRNTAAKDWEMPAEPVKLNPKNLNMTVFNQLFEQTRIPDPDEDGYGDWLKDNGRDNGTGNNSSSKKGGKKFSENFNREVFNRMFEEEQSEDRSNGQLTVFNQPQEMILSQSAGVELGRDRPSDYTSAYDSGIQFTDLRSAYTKENTVSQNVRGIKVEDRDFNSYKAQREKAPPKFNQAELDAMASYESQQKQKENQRQLRAAQEHIQAQDYFSRMKQLVITEK